MIKYTQIVCSMRTALLGTALTMALIGCQPTTPTEGNEQEGHELSENHEHEHHEDEEHMHDEHDHHEGEEHLDDSHDHAGHNHDDNRIKFKCEPELDIAAFYHDDSTPKTAHLLIEGIEYDLSAIDTDSTQNTFVGEIGLDDGHGLVWQIDNDTALLSAVPVAQATGNITLDSKEILHKCHKAS